MADRLSFDYSGGPWPIREDIAASFRYTWQKFAEPGNWLTASERVAAAAQVRSARHCELCARSAMALSPFSATGSHDTNPSVAGDPLNPQMIDVLHRLTTDAARLTESYVHEQQTAGGFDDGVYVELLSIVVSLVAIDSFHRALGLPLEPLPAPQAGAPSRYRPTAVRTDAAWVPTVPLDSVAEQDADMYADLVRAANVLTAMSLVPDAVRLLQSQGAAMYMAPADVANPQTNAGRALSRPQIELIAGRVSALRQCFY